MKIITLNTWVGKVSFKLHDFIEKHQEVDIFLLQEVTNSATERTVWDDSEQKELFRNINNLLPDHDGFFNPSVFDEWGLAMFIKKDIQIIETGEVFVHSHRDSMIGVDCTTVGRNIQYATLVYKESPITIINFHGLWNGGGKTDTDDRIAQSKRIVDFIKNISHNVILAGDFNLLPDTESLKMIEKELGLRNLISDYNVISTRTSHYTKPEKYADYIFVSPDIEVKNFAVLPDEVSDHAPLFMEI